MIAVCDYVAHAFDESADWRDKREPGENGKWHGYVIHKDSDDHYGHFSNADSNGIIRAKLAFLALTARYRAFSAAFFRAGHLISGYWIWGQGVPEALADWKKERFICYLTNDRASAPGSRDLYKRIALCSLKHLGWAALKLATYPLCLILSAGCFFVSIPRPFLARRLFGQIEEAWSLPVYFPSLFASTMNFQAPCMQPKRVWKAYGLYETNPCDKIDDLLSQQTQPKVSQIRELRKLAAGFSHYFPSFSQSSWLKLEDVVSEKGSNHQILNEAKTHIEKIEQAVDRWIENSEESGFSLADHCREWNNLFLRLTAKEPGHDPV